MRRLATDAMLHEQDRPRTPGTTPNARGGIADAVDPRRMVVCHSSVWRCFRRWLSRPGLYGPARCRSECPVGGRYGHRDLFFDWGGSHTAVPGPKGVLLQSLYPKLAAP